MSEPGVSLGMAGREEWGLMGPAVVVFRQRKVEVSPEEVRLQPEAGASAWVDEVTALCRLPEASKKPALFIAFNGP